VLFQLIALGGTAAPAGSDEEQPGAQASRSVEEQIGIYKGQFLANYVDAVGRRLAASLDDPPHRFRFKIVDRAEPNTFALPGGHIYVSRGFLAQINSEDELAGLLAHEISHVILGHHVQHVSRDDLPGLLTLPGQDVSAIVGDDLGKMINAPIDAAGRVSLFSYSRSQESEADRAGMSLAAKAGYDPAALGNVLDTLDKLVVLTGGQQTLSFYESHPTTLSRVEDINALATPIQWKPTRPFAVDHARFLDRINGLWWGSQNPSNGVFQGQKFVQADMRFTMTFPDGWRLVNAPGYVGAFEPDKKALVVLGGAGPPMDPSVPAKALVTKFKDEANVSPAESRAVKIGPWPGHLVHFEDTSGVEPVGLSYLWVASPRTTFIVIGLGVDEYRDQLRDAALSLRGLSIEERDSIYADRIRIEAAEGHESLSELSSRSDNLWDDEMTAVMNGLSVDAELEEGALIKVVRRDRYWR
jgi:predicted Zn-dependent protease